MPNWWAKDYSGGAFVLGSPPHLGVLALLVALCAGTWLLRGRVGPAGQRAIRHTLAAALLLAQLVWYAWHLAWGLATYYAILPFHLCSTMLFLTVALLLTRDARLYPLCYFVGVGGALQGMLTPDPGIYGFPHIRFFQTMVSHGGLILAGVYLTVVEGFRPTGRDLGRALIALQLYALLVGFVNFGLGTNFMFLSHKPGTPSALDLFGPWPWYLAAMQVIAALVCALLYLPFALADWRRARAQPPRLLPLGDEVAG